MDEQPTSTRTADGDGSRPRLPVAIVTGAGRRRGIGRAIALGLASDGFAVVVHERSSDRAGRPSAEVESGWQGARSVVDEIERMGCNAVVAAGDVRDPATAERLVEAAAHLGDIAVLVNNHGTAGGANSHLAHETPADLWDETMSINVGSLRTLMAAVVPAMRASGVAERAVVHLSSTAGHRALARYGAYCASKAAVERLTEQQALELARDRIRVNCVAPGLTPTDMIDGTLDRAAQHAGADRADIEARVLRSIPLRRFADPSDIADAVVFLAGRRARYITGQVVTVDGGMSL
jgi:NAD(P)-dependent dehydrogenase (short-subunit alcohol dehydrogenase family)